MTKRTKKPAKGVPMPKCFCWQCAFREVDDGKLVPFAILNRVLHAEWACNIEEIVKEYHAVRKWLANPATPKGVRR